MVREHICTRLDERFTKACAKFVFEYLLLCPHCCIIA
jgi:hypothetical protein